MKRVGALTSGVLVLVALTAREAGGPVGPDAVWRPSTQVVAGIRQVCDQYSVPKLGVCFSEEMARQAKLAAVAFTRSIHNEGWLDAFRNTGRVGLAYVEYPFRANNNQGCLLVNGSPALLDVDDSERWPREEMKADPAWRELLAAKPNAAIFPGDRAGVRGPVAIQYGDGAQQFIVDYTVVDGCHACAVLALAFFGFEFNAKGRLSSVEYLGLQTAPQGVLAGTVFPVRVRAAEKFGVALDGAASVWSLPQPPAEWILRSLGPSEGLWKFEVVGAGTTQMTVRRGAQDLVLKVMAAPGLRR